MKLFESKKLVKLLEYSEETKQKCKEIIKLVAGGLTAEQACKVVGIGRSTLYAVLTLKEKLELKQAKMLNSNTRDPYY